MHPSSITTPARCTLATTSSSIVWFVPLYLIACIIINHTNLHHLNTLLITFELLVSFDTVTFMLNNRSTATPHSHLTSRSGWIANATRRRAFERTCGCYGNDVVHCSKAKRLEMSIRWLANDGKGVIGAKVTEVMVQRLLSDHMDWVMHSEQASIDEQ